MTRLLMLLLIFLPSMLSAAVGSLEELQARRLEAFDDPRSFRIELEDTLKSVDRNASPEFWAALHAYAGEASWFQEQNDVARGHVEAALDFAHEHGFLKYVAILTYVKGGVLEYDARNDEAEVFYLKAIDVARQSNDQALIAYTANAAGAFFHRIGKGEHAMEAYKDIFAILHTMPRDVIYYDMLATIGTLYTQTIGVRREEGLRMVREALEFVKVRPWRYETYWVSQALLRILQNSHEQDEVEKLLDLDLMIAKSLQYENYIASTHLDRGILRLKNKRYEEAKSDLEFAKAYYHKNGVPFYNISVVAHLGTAYVALKEYEKISQLLRDFPDAVKSATSLHQKEEMNAMLQEYYQATGQTQKELETLRDQLKVTTQYAHLKRAEEIGRLTRDMEVMRQQFLNENLSAENLAQKEEIQRRQRTQRLLAGVIVLGALALAASAVSLRRGREIKRQRANLKVILDHIEEGMLRFESDLIVQSGYSHFSRVVLNHQDELAGQNIWNLFFAKTKSKTDEKQVWRESMGAIFGESRLAWDLNEGNLPRRVVLNEHVLALDWQRISNQAGETQAILLLIRDITDQVAAGEQAEKAQAEISRMAQRIEVIARGRPQRIAQFLLEVENNILAFEKNPTTAGENSGIKRMLHTLKGAARTLGLVDMTENVHSMESLFCTPNVDMQEFQQQVQNLKRNLAAYRELLPHLNMMQEQALENLWDIGSKILPEARERLRVCFEKPAIITIVDRCGDWGAIDLRHVHDMLLHAFTNSVDHGFLLPHARGEHRTDAPALSLESYRDDSKLHLVIRDNGAGLNWKKLKKMADERNFVPALGRELTDLLFQEGASTSDQVSTTSGRGIGLSAIHDIVRNMGGDVRLEANDRGSGTVLRISLPLDMRVSASA